MRVRNFKVRIAQGDDMRKQSVKRRDYVGKDGKVLFDYHVFSEKVSKELLQTLIDNRIQSIGRMPDDDNRRCLALELMILVNCRDYLN